MCAACISVLLVSVYCWCHCAVGVSVCCWCQCASGVSLCCWCQCVLLVSVCCWFQCVLLVSVCAAGVSVLLVSVCAAGVSVLLVSVCAAGVSVCCWCQWLRHSPSQGGKITSETLAPSSQAQLQAADRAFEAIFFLQHPGRSTPPSASWLIPFRTVNRLTSTPASSRLVPMTVSGPSLHRW